ncbi:hypothetical protein TTHERM_00624300 (macronuclear) [Tetrahymena thermophila SB210]|uniref:Uncharacterized protein n=1 Tax=Tetrahymena thermophila (strain SB210) TaxID=312017 RepID=Q240V3_TETTS|nr:hypothetical protein TTHERM_00624300 [Tetrahymena thermophila SB210]EAS02311.2 hypothetical protein TTHERM_00624300 [Tetrahymena thermophila SB210]|eukprot:XP_001022556.2 hypothetical protein TTHERM_00624300 [Tetrahymena thermophila SB210]
MQMENQINSLVDEFARENEDVKTVLILDKTGLPLNTQSGSQSQQFSKDAIPYLKFLSDHAKNLKLQQEDSDPVVTITTQNEQIVIKSYDAFTVAVKKGREVASNQ